MDTPCWSPARREGAVPRGTRVVVATAFAVLSMTLSACSGGSAHSAARSPSSPVTPSSPTPPSTGWTAPQRQVIGAYTAFWRALPEASRAKTADSRLGLLIPMTTDPELSQLVAGLGRQRASGRALYGTNVPRPIHVDINGTRAVVRDCQDSHRAGIEDVKTGAHLTVGVDRHLVMAVLVLRDSAWKVSTVQYAPSGTPC